MRNKKAKALRKDVMLKMYLGDGVTEKDLKKNKHDVFDSPDFKPVYRARKKNEMKTSPTVKLMDEVVFEEKLVKMREVRIKSDKFRKHKINLRQYKPTRK